MDKEPKMKKPKLDKFSKRTSRLRKTSNQFIANRALLDWQYDSDLVKDNETDEYSVPEIQDLLDIILRTMTGASLLENANSAKLQILYDEQVEFSQFYPEQNVITINPNRPKGDLLNMLSKELRRFWQASKGNLVNPLDFEPDQAIFLNRASQADVMMFSIKIAWELKLQKYNEFWDFMISASSSDVTRVFENHAREDFRALNNGIAARATYDKWFEESRMKMSDKSIIHQMLLNETGYMHDLNKEEFIGYESLIKIGEMPHGSNYLTLSSAREIDDPDYTMIGDRSNANFLWFIKFERGFQEKEQEMIEESISKSAEIISFTKRIEEMRVR